MEPDKPLHVRVAEALGCTPGFSFGEWECGDHRCECSTILDDDGEEYNDYRIPRYDTDWSATGPLIEKYRITVEYWPEAGFFDWIAFDPSTSPIGVDPSHITGQTPLIAVCNLILALKESGKLNP